MKKFFLLLKKLFLLYFQRQSKRIQEIDFKIETGYSYRIYWALSADPKRLSEIDKTIRFFTGELISINQRKNGLLLNPNEKIYTFLRKGFDTETGKKYSHKLDILESEIMKIEFVG